MPPPVLLREETRRLVRGRQNVNDRSMSRPWVHSCAPACARRRIDIIMDPFRKAEQPDLYVAYLAAYFSTVCTPDVSAPRVDTPSGAREALALVIGVEDAINFRRDPSGDGCRARRDLNRALDRYESAEEPEAE